MKPKTIILVLLWLMFIGITTFLAMNTATGRWDFITYHHNAERLMNGELLYSGYTARYDYIYPPLLAQLIAPFTAIFRLDIISLAWHILSFILLIVSIWLVNQTVEQSRRRWMFWLVPIIFVPNYQSLWVGQISMVLLGCFTGAWFAYKHKQPYLTGILLSLATWLKIYPIFLIGYFILKRDWKVTLGALSSGLILLGLQILLTDLDTLKIYFTDILPGLASEGQMMGLFKNSSIVGFSFKLLIETSDVIPLVNNPALANILRWLITTVMIGISLILLLTGKKETTEITTRFDIEYGLVVLVSLLFASTLWVSGMPPLILCYLLLLQQTHSKYIRRFTWLSFIIVSLYFLFLLAFQPGNQLPWYSLSLGFYGVFGLWILYIYQLYTMREVIGS